MSAPPIGLVSWKRPFATNFTKHWHWEVLEYPYTVFCEAVPPVRARFDRRADASGIPETDICQKCVENMDRTAAHRMTLEKA